MSDEILPYMEVFLLDVNLYDDLPAVGEERLGLLIFERFSRAVLLDGDEVVAAVGARLRYRRRRASLFLPGGDKRGACLLFFGADARVIARLQARQSFGGRQPNMLF